VWTFQLVSHAVGNGGLHATEEEQAETDLQSHNPQNGLDTTWLINSISANFLAQCSLEDERRLQHYPGS
jgi:hypothetical protein